MRLAGDLFHQRGDMPLHPAAQIVRQHQDDRQAGLAEQLPR